MNMFDAFTFYNKVSRIPTDVTNTNHNLHIDIIVDGQFFIYDQTQNRSWFLSQRKSINVSIYY